MIPPQLLTNKILTSVTLCGKNRLFRLTCVSVFISDDAIKRRHGENQIVTYAGFAPYHCSLCGEETTTAARRNPGLPSLPNDDDRPCPAGRTQQAEARL